LKLKCTTLAFSWVSAPDPAGGAYSAPRTVAGFKGLLLRERRGEERKWERREGK